MSLFGNSRGAAILDKQSMAAPGQYGGPRRRALSPRKGEGGSERERDAPHWPRIHSDCCPYEVVSTQSPRKVPTSSFFIPTLHNV